MQKTDTTNPGKKFRYQEILDTLAVPCPPGDFEERETVAYRWVFDTMDDGRNFLPQYVKNPPRFEHKPDAVKCLALGLSFFDTVENAKSQFENLRRKLLRWDWASLGENIAAGHLLTADGESDLPNLHGHFTFFPHQGADFAQRFNIHSSLKNDSDAS